MCSSYVGFRAGGWLLMLRVEFEWLVLKLA